MNRFAGKRVIVTGAAAGFGAAIYLASPEAGFLTGVCLDVDAGRSIQ